MQVTRDDLAEFERLLAKLRENPAAVDEEADLPAADYFRVTCLTTVLLVYVCVSMIISICTTGIYGALSQIEFLLWPLCWTALWGLLIYGTIDSDAAGRRAVLILRVCGRFLSSSSPRQCTGPPGCTAKLHSCSLLSS